MKKTIFLLFLSFLLVSCDSPSVSYEVDVSDDKLRVAVFLYRSDDYFIYSVNESMLARFKDKSDEYGELVVDVYDGKNQNEIQLAQIKEALSRKYDVLVVNIVERSSASKIIDMAKEADVPVLFFNRQPLDMDMARWDKLYYVGLDGISSGRMQGELVVDYFKGHPKMDKNRNGKIDYIMLQGQYNHQDTILRSKYSIEAIKAAGIELNELARETANWQRTEAKSIVSNLASSYGDEIELIISNNDMMAMGALDGLNEIRTELEKTGNDKYLSDIAIVGVDGIEPVIEAMKNGEIIGTVLNDAARQGEVLADMAYVLASGKEPSEVFEDMEAGRYYWIKYKKINLESVEKDEKND